MFAVDEQSDLQKPFSVVGAYSTLGMVPSGWVREMVEK